MNNDKDFVAELTKLLERAKIDTSAKYLTAKQVEAIYGIPRKTVLNRSNLLSTHKRFLPSVKLKGGRRKYFERKVLDRFFIVTTTDQEGENDE